MAASLIVAALVRDEAPRFWGAALHSWGTFADEILVLDDGSTDETPRMAQDAGAIVRRRAGGAMWGQEASARERLWSLAWNAASEGDYVFVLDADMVPARSPRILMETGADTIFFTLYDLWAPGIYREDALWQGHLHPRAWMFRKRPIGELRWSDRGIHTGHAPLNYPLGSLAFAPRDFSLLHYGYINSDIRREKHARYMSVAAQLSASERRHAETILDAKPALYALPFEPDLTL